jgi:RNA polymerase sigma-70 factor (ECF subfamily)
VRVHDKLGQFRADARFTTWLYRVAYSVALNRKKRARLRLPHVSVDILHAIASADDPHDVAVAAERASDLAAAVEGLPDLYRTVIYLHYWQETSVEEIAALLGAPPNTIKSYLFRARARIERALAAKGITS